MTKETIYVLSDVYVGFAWGKRDESGREQLESALTRNAKPNEEHFLSLAHLRHDVYRIRRWENPPYIPSVAFVNLSMPSSDLPDAIRHVRQYLPHAVFVLYATDTEYRQLLSEVPAEWADRLKNYFRLHKSYDDEGFDGSVRKILDDAISTALRRKEEIKFYSAFISYSHKDKAFAQWLYEQLRGFGIPCWLDEKQLRAGDRIHTHVQNALDKWDKVLLCASHASLTSWWVDTEINSAIAREQRLWQERGKETLVLIPLNLDGYIFSDSWQSGWKSQITSRVAPDFTDWKPTVSRLYSNFSIGLQSIYRALRADDLAKEKPPDPIL